MIKTHRPKGHNWTCATHFQQSKQYRNLDAESWEIRSSKTLIADPDDGLPRSSRVAKRRRVETLANDFLDGKPLFISSATSNGHELTESVENVLHERRLGWDELLDDHDENIWADGDDGWAFLRKRSKQRTASKPSGDCVDKTCRNTPTHSNGVPIIRHPSEPSTRNIFQSRPKVSMAPSEDALARAAELRARKGLLTTGNAVLPNQLAQLSGNVTQSAPSTAKAPTSFKQCSSSRPFNPHTPAETTMADELRLSRTESPSRRPRAFSVPAESFTSDTTVEDPSSGMDGDGALRFAQQDGHIPPAPSAPPMNTGSTAMEICTAEQNRESSADQRRAAWTPINTRHTNRDVVNTGSSTRQTQSSGVAAADRSTLESVTKSITRSSKMQSAKSTNKVSTCNPSTSPSCQKNTPSQRSRNGNSQSSSQQRLTRSFTASKTKVTIQEKSQNGSTPFVYRKKTKVTKNEQPIPAETPSAHQCHENDPQAHETVNITHRPSAPIKLPPVPAVSPTLDLNIQDDSSFAPNLNMVVVDEHVNKTSPDRVESSHQSPARKALENGVRLSGVDLARVPGGHSSPPPHELLEEPSQPTIPQNNSLAEDNHTSRPERRSTGQWPGTQVLLNQAQYDLFMSPDKLMPATAATGSEYRQGHNMNVGEVQAPEDTRYPLQELSQEQMPGTQALMDNWSPWSTAKKPKKRASFATKDNVTPTGAASRSLRPNTKRSFTASERVCESVPRRSSLRFALSTFETPMALKQQNPSNTRTSPVSGTPINHKNAQSISHAAPTPSHDPEPTNNDIDLNLSNFSFAATDAQTFADVDDSMMDWSSHDKRSSFQNAKGQSIDPAPEQTLADLATEFLSTADIDGILGRV